MTAQQAFEAFNNMTIEEALSTTVPFGKYEGKTVGEITFGYAEWVRENIQAAFANESKFRFLYAVSTFMESPKAICPDSNSAILNACIA